MSDLPDYLLELLPEGFSLEIATYGDPPMTRYHVSTKGAEWRIGMRWTVPHMVRDLCRDWPTYEREMVAKLVREVEKKGDENDTGTTSQDSANYREHARPGIP